MGPTLPRPAEAAGPGEADAAVGRHRPPGRRRLAPRDRAGHSPQPVGVALGQRGLPGVGLRHGPRAARPAEARRAAGSGADRRLLLERRPGAGHGAVAARHRARRRAESHRRSCRGARPRHPAGVRAPARGDAGARPRRSRPVTGPPTTAGPPGSRPDPPTTRPGRPPHSSAVSQPSRRPTEQPRTRSRPSRCAGGGRPPRGRRRRRAFRRAGAAAAVRGARRTGRAGRRRCRHRSRGCCRADR